MPRVIEDGLKGRSPDEVQVIHALLKGVPSRQRKAGNVAARVRKALEKLVAAGVTPATWKPAPGFKDTPPAEAVAVIVAELRRLTGASAPRTKAPARPVAGQPTGAKPAPTIGAKPAGAIPPGLQKDIEEAKVALGKAVTGDANARYDLAVVVARVKERSTADKYGEGAVKKLASEIGVGSKILYKYAEVTRRWNGAQFKEVAARPSKSGRTLPWTAFLVIAEVEDGRARNGLVTEALKGNLSISKIRDLVAEKNGKEAPSLAKQLSALAGGCRRLGKRVKDFFAAKGIRRGKIDDEAAAGAGKLDADLDELASIIANARTRLAGIGGAGSQPDGEPDTTE